MVRKTMKGETINMFKKVFTAVFILLFTFAAYSSIGGKTTYAAGGVSLYTPYPGVTLSPGDSMDYSVDLINNTGSIKQGSFKIEGLPKKWDYKISATGNSLNQLAVKPGESQSFTLTVDVPLKVDKGSYSFKLVAEGDGFTASLPMTINVSQQGTFKTELSVDQPNMQGTADADFSYTATLKNHTAHKQRYALSANAPKGWDVVFKSGGQNVTSVVVDPGSSKDITVTMNPPEKVKAGDYKATIKASSGSTKAKNVLEAVITGTYDLQLTTPSGRLSADITAGHKQKVKLKVINKGSAPLRNIDLSASAPPNWNVNFDTPKIQKIAPNQSKTVEATIKASDKAIAGDYVVKLSADADQASSDATFRMSVKTSMLWGWIGVLIVIAVLAGIYYLFRTYGRR